MDDNVKKAYDWKNSGYPLPEITNRSQLEEAYDLMDSVRELAHEEPNALDGNRVNELMSDIHFADSRHWTFQWQIIVGAILSVFILNWCSSHKEEEIAKQQAIVEQVNAWQEKDTTIALSAFKNTDYISKFVTIRYESPAKYKAYQLEQTANQYYTKEKAERYYTEEMNKPSASEEWKKKCEEYIKEARETWPTEKVRLTEEYDRISNLKFAEVQEMAIADATGTLNMHQKSKKNMKFWFWFLAICIPLYIIACRPYGYSMNRYALESKTLNVIQKIGLWLSGGLVAVAGAIQFRTIITRYTDGSTTESDDGLGPAKAVTKGALFVAAVLVFCFTCCFIMAYATIVGLIRNYDWAAIFSGAKKRAGEIKAKNAKVGKV